MKIAEVESLLLGGAHFVRITTDEGLVGLGQSACWAYPEAVDAVIGTFRGYLLGQNPHQIERHWQHLYRMGPFRGSVLSGAVSAVDIALWDLKGQALQAPIWELLGGMYRDRIRLHLLMAARRHKTCGRTLCRRPRRGSPPSNSIPSRPDTAT